MHIYFPICSLKLIIFFQKFQKYIFAENLMFLKNYKK